MTERLAPLVVCGIFAALGALIFRPGVVDWDGAAHFAYLHSAFFDDDLDFSNDLVPQDALIPTPTGRIGNKHPVGPAILWAPFFLGAGVTCVAVGGLLPGLCQWGYGWPYVVGISLASALYGLAGLWAVYGLCRRFFTWPIALFAVLAVWLASPLLAYMYVVPSMPHALVFCVAALFLSLWWAVPRRPGLSTWFAWGLVGGLLAVVRWQEAIWAILALFAALYALQTAGRQHMRAALRRSLLQLVCFGAGMLLVFSPQMVVWNALYGSPLTLPQGDGFLQWTRPAIAEVLFSARHGLFAWMPLAVLCLFGLAALWRRERRLLAPLALILLLELYINSIVTDWWSGGAFGPRRFIGVLPIMALGFAGLVDWVWRRRALRVALAAVCVALIVGQWMFMSEFFTAMVLPDQPLTWPDAIALVAAPAMTLRRWLILEPGIVGSWHMGPYGTLAATLLYALLFAALPAVAIMFWRATSGWLRRRDRLWRAGLLFGPLMILIIDVFLKLLK